MKKTKSRLIATIKSLSFDNSSNKNTQNKISNNSFNSQILQELFKIQDGIKDLNEKISISKTDTAAISVLADKLADNSSKPSTEETIMQTFFQALINEPNKVGPLLELMDKFSN